MSPLFSIIYVWSRGHGNEAGVSGEINIICITTGRYGRRGRPQMTLASNDKTRQCFEKKNNMAMKSGNMKAWNKKLEVDIFHET